MECRNLGFKKRLGGFSVSRRVNFENFLKNRLGRLYRFSRVGSTAKVTPGASVLVPGSELAPGLNVLMGSSSVSEPRVTSDVVDSAFSRRSSVTIVTPSQFHGA